MDAFLTQWWPQRWTPRLVLLWLADPAPCARGSALACSTPGESEKS